MQSVPFGTPSLFNSRRKASDGKEESPPQGLVQGTPCTPSFDGDTPTMLRRLRSPPPSPTGKFKRDAAKLAFAAVVGILMLSTLFSYRMTMGSAADERLSVLTTLVRSQADEMVELQKTVRTQSSTIASLAARGSKSEAASKPKLEGTPSGVGTAGVATPEKSSGRKHVHVVFRFDEDRRMGKEVQLFWLYENNTEQLYTTIPAGLQADETTFPGQCWRAVPRRRSNLGPPLPSCRVPHLVTPRPHARLPPFHLAARPSLGQPPALVLRDERAAADGAHRAIDQRQARLPLPAHCQAGAARARPRAGRRELDSEPRGRARAGRSRLDARRGGRQVQGRRGCQGPRPAAAADDGGAILTMAVLTMAILCCSRWPSHPLHICLTPAAHPLLCTHTPLPPQASHEAEQHVDIGSSVALTVQLPATAFGPAELFWLWGGDDAFAREHLHGSVLPGQTLRIATMAGEQWIAKDKASGTVLLTTTTTDAAEQSVELSAVAAPAVEKKAARFVKAARRK
eukprot:scaffold30850_cov73-Phaeocystis_antarctica.AAC.1